MREAARITIANQLQKDARIIVTLDSLPIGQKALVASVDRAVLGEAAALRLRAMGVDAGAEVETVQRGVLWSRDPLAVRVGRMMVAIRRAQAAAIHVEPLA